MRGQEAKRRKEEARGSRGRRMEIATVGGAPQGLGAKDAGRKSLGASLCFSGQRCGRAACVRKAGARLLACPGSSWLRFTPPVPSPPPLHALCGAIFWPEDSGVFRFACLFHFIGPAAFTFSGSSDFLFWFEFWACWPCYLSFSSLFRFARASWLRESAGPRCREVSWSPCCGLSLVIVHRGDLVVLVVVAPGRSRLFPFFVRRGTTSVSRASTLAVPGLFPRAYFSRRSVSFLASSSRTLVAFPPISHANVTPIVKIKHRASE